MFQRIFLSSLPVFDLTPLAFLAQINGWSFVSLLVGLQCFLVRINH